MRLAAAIAGCVAALSPAVSWAGEPARSLETVREVPGAVRRCWNVPAGLRGFERLDVTVRFAVRADGSLIGERRVSYLAAPVDARARELLARSALAAVESCTPLPLSAGLGQAIAGRVFAVRFIYRGPQGRGA